MSVKLDHGLLDEVRGVAAAAASLGGALAREAGGCAKS